MEPENNEHTDGEWNSVGKGGKGSKKQKKKNRTIPWQTFMSQGERISQSPDGFGSSGESLCRDDSLKNVELTEEEMVVKASLITFFTDLLRRLGPVKRDDPRIKSEFDGISDQGQLLVKRYGTLQDFLVLDESIAVIDDFICLQSDIEAARSLALAYVMEKAALMNGEDEIADVTPITNHLNYPSKANFTNFGKSVSSSNIKSSNVWNTYGSSSSNDPWLQQHPPAEVDSFKTIQPPPPLSKSSVVSIPSSFPIPPPPLISDPPPPALIQPPPIANGYSSVVAAGTLNEQNEALNKRLKGLSECNAELLKQVAEKERVINALSNLIPDKRELHRVERLEKELRETREQFVKVNNENEEYKKHLKAEMLKSRQSQRDYENERSERAKVTEKYNALLKSTGQLSANHNLLPTPSSMYLPALQSPNRNMAPISSPISTNDSLGLRSIWNNASKSPSIVERQPQYSSSAGSIMLQKPQTQPQQTTYQPNIMAQASQLSNIFGNSMFEFNHGGFGPLATSAITTTTTTSVSSSSSGASSSLLYGNHKCL